MVGPTFFRGGEGQGVQGSLEQLSARLARDGETLLDALDRLAPSYLGGGRPDLVLQPHIDKIVRIPFRGHPWSQLLVAAVLWDIRRDDPSIPRLVESASRAFTRRRDLGGLGYVAHVRGNFALGRGQLQDAAFWWEQARHVLGEDAPSSEMNIAFLALGAYQRGDLRAATKLAEEALALARLRGHRRGEGLALVFVAFFALTSGAFSRAESALALAEQAWSDLPATEDATDLPLLHGARGVLLALRGHEAAAEDAFNAGLEASTTVSNPWHGAIALASRAELLVRRDPARSLADARTARDTFERLGDEWFNVWALRAEGVAIRECGDAAAGETMLRDLLSTGLDAIERARTQLALGETLIGRGARAEAVPLLREGFAAAERLGLRYWQACTAALLATAEPGKTAYWHRRVQALTVKGEPAYEAILVRPGRFAVKLAGPTEIAVDGAPLRFLTRRAELLVKALAEAGRPGLQADELLERLWPEVRADVGRHRLRTALWEARRVLGVEAWRLSREGDRVALDLTGALLDPSRSRR